VIPARFERATHSLEGCCSIQLSYGTLFLYLNKLEIIKTLKVPSLVDDPSRDIGIALPDSYRDN
jgi:hypothetical protein